MAINDPRQQIQLEHDVPPPGRAVIVQCEGFRCAAYRTEDGKWKTIFGNEPLENVIQFYLDLSEETIA